MAEMCKLDTRFHESKDVSEIKGVDTVSLSSKLSTSDKMRAKDFSVLLVDVPQEDGTTKFFRATLNSKVPTNTEVIRNSSGQLVGIPAVSGG